MRIRLLDNGEAVFATVGPSRGGGTTPQLWVASLAGLYQSSTVYNNFGLSHSGEPSMHTYLASIKKIKSANIRQVRLTPVAGKTLDGYDPDNRLLRGDPGDEHPFKYRKEFPAIDVNMYSIDTEPPQWRIGYCKRHYRSAPLTDGQTKWLHEEFDTVFKVWAAQQQEAFDNKDKENSVILNAIKFAINDYNDRIFRELVLLRKNAFKAIDMVGEEIERMEGE